MTKNLKLFSLALITPLLLNGCLGFGGSDDTVATESSETHTLYETSDFTIIFPNEWETISQTDFTSTVPSQTIVAFRSNIKNEEFTANLNITRTLVDEELTSADFGKSSKSKAKNSLIGFEEIDTTETEVLKGEDTRSAFILEFQGKKEATDPIVNFKQLYVVDNGLGYTITSSYLAGEDESVVNTLDQMLESFALK